MLAVPRYVNALLLSAALCCGCCAAIAAGQQNVARNKPFLSSDPNNNHARGNWLGLTDGEVTDSNKDCYATGRDKEFPKSVIVDLKALYQLSEIRIYNASHGGTRTVRLAVSADNETWKQIDEHTFENYDAGLYKTSVPDSLPPVQFVKAVFVNHYDVGFMKREGLQYFMFLREMEVFGEKTADSDLALAAYDGSRKQDRGGGRDAAGKIERQVDSILKRDYEVEVIRDVTYGQGGDTSLKLDVYRPAELDRPAPACIVIHGGGWVNGSKERGNFVRMARDYAGMGVVAFCINYRLARVAPAPAALEDVKCAARFVRANAERYSVDPERIFTEGASAGAHLALMLGMCDDPAFEGDGGWEGVSSRVAAVVDHSGITDVYDVTYGDHARGWGRAWLRVDEGRTELLARRLSPLHYVDNSGLPPIFIHHGSRDEIVPFDQALRLYVHLLERGRPVELVIRPGAGHGKVKAYASIQKAASEYEERRRIRFLVEHGILK